jgi:peptidoglycan DL-endopeptidase CwlO
VAALRREECRRLDDAIERPGLRVRYGRLDRRGLGALPRSGYPLALQKSGAGAEVAPVRRPLLVIVMLAGSWAHAAAARVSLDPPRLIKRPTLAHHVVAFAERQVGVPYRYGGSSRSAGFDCSGLVYAAYRSIGRTVPHSSWGQMALGTSVSFGRLRPGDLLFTDGGGHVVLVVSKRSAVEAPHSGARVSYVRLSSLRGRFAGGRRLLR